jgi:hypothetical protein
MWAFSITWRPSFVKGDNGKSYLFQQFNARVISLLADYYNGEVSI